MKVRVLMELDIPEKSTLKIERQEIFDEFLNYAVASHLEKAAEWLEKSKNNKESTEYVIYQHHKFWADILEKAKKTMKVEKIK